MTDVLIGAGAAIATMYALQRLKWDLRRTLTDELKRFFKGDPYKLPIVSRTFATVDLPNLQLAITRYAEDREAKTVVIGYTTRFGGLHNSLRELIAQEDMFEKVKVGPVQYREVDTDVDSQTRCVENGIHLISLTEGKVAAHVRSDMMRDGTLELEVMSRSEERGSAFVEAIREYVARCNVYRGKTISLECGEQTGQTRGCANVRFHRLTPITREEIILPEETMSLIERNTVRFLHHADVLRRSGRSVKRGLLLHGKPGTGKTYTVKWLAQSLKEVTVILMSGEQLGLIKECCQMARMLAPSLVIMEDVDLIATQRDESRHPAYQVTLHQLLNEMDGLTSDAEVIFVLTTNRPQAIEPALAARPGRIDQAIEYPLPDADCRRKLLELYGRGLCLDLKDVEHLVSKTDGASPAFIQELIRKASLIAAEEDSTSDGKLRVTDRHCDMALRELVLGGGELTRNLLGFGAELPTPVDLAQVKNR